jgi:serine/threonine protein kinase
VVGRRIRKSAGALTEERWSAAWAIYEAACELPVAERREFVEAALPDPAEAQKILSMLDRMEAPDQPPAGSEAAVEPDRAVEEWQQLGKTLGRFVVIGPLGRGGMGEVYTALDPELNRTVALKFLSPGSIGSTGGVNQFIREAQAASALNHPGIVTVHEVTNSGSSLAIVMELVEGTSLRTLCGKPNPIEHVTNWGRQAAQALAAAHARGIVHRDIKPQNLMLRPDGLVKILDFGIARDVADQDSLDSIPLGTLGYMSPEQIGGGTLTRATDIFSLGVVLYELAAGAHPFLAKTASETTRAIALLDPGATQISGAARVGQRDLDLLIRAMLAKDPSHRPDAAAVATELEKIGRRREGGVYRRALSWALPTLGVGLAAAVWWATMHRTEPVRKPPRISQFTSLDGSEEQASFSPDGRKIAFAWNGPDNSNQDIYIQEIGGEAPVRITTDTAEDSNPVWSPDGKQIAFLRKPPGESRHLVVIVPATGGAERPVAQMLEMEYFYRPLAWWPDGGSLIVRDESKGSVGFVRLILATGEKRPLTIPTGTDRDSQAVVSPDGRRLVFARHKGSNSGVDICVVPLAGGKEECILNSRVISGMAWAHEGKEILYSDGIAIWRITVGPNAAGSRVKIAEGEFRDLTGDRQGRRLAADRGYTDTNLWRVGRHGESRVKLIASSRIESDAGYSPDGERIVFRSDRSGTFELWSAAKDGSGPIRLTNFGGRLGSARWSPDGKQIAFDGFASPSEPSKNTNIYVVPASGGGVRRVTDDRALSFVPNWSHDGRWIYYIVQRGSRWETWKTPSQGGAPVMVSGVTGMFDITESADGRYLYYTTPRGAKGIRRRLVDGGEETLVAGTEGVQLYRYWQLSGKELYFVEGPADPVVRCIDLTSGRATRLATLSPLLQRGPRGLTVSPDGASFLFVQVDSRQSDIYLIEDIE